MTLNALHCYRALESRDPRFDGRFFTGVKTTGIYCRPICPARRPHRKNVTFYACAAAAEAAGFRPCRRCRPETAPGTPDWVGSSAVVSRAMRLISEGVLDGASVDALAARLDVGRRQLDRLFAEHLGASPLSVAQTRRVHFARRLIDETQLKMIDVALGAGFSSVRRFNAAIQSAFGATPRELRGNSRPARESSDILTLRIPYRPPYAWTALLNFLRPRALPGVEVVLDDRYRRSIEFDGVASVIEIRQADDGHALELSMPIVESHRLLDVVRRVRRLFDVNADPIEIGAQLCRDADLRPIVRKTPGLRVPGAWCGFELAVRGILGQQVSVKGATTISGRLVEQYGRRINDVDNPSVDQPRFIFPPAYVLAEASLDEIGIPGARARAIRGLANAVADGMVDFEELGSPDEARAALCALPGIGPWTADYIALRALGEPDAFPSGDLGLQKALAAPGDRWSATKLEKRSELWRPWRAYATIHLWNRLGSGG